jgi:hypothetical protein
MGIPQGWKQINQWLKDQIAFSDRELKTEITIHLPNSAFTHTSNYVVYIGMPAWNRIIARKEFKTKLVALAFAYKYMKAHPRG